jgi:hypothetical protein
LGTTRNGTSRVGKTGSRGSDGSLVIKWNGSRLSNRQSTNKFGQISSLVLTLKQAVKLGIYGSLVTIRDGYRVGLYEII